MTRPSPEVARLQAELVAQLDAICAAGALARAAVMLAAERAGRPAAKVLAFERLTPKLPAWPRTREDVALFNGPLGAARRKAPIQLCPGPGCGNRAAPAYSMLCASHKDADKATVRAWRSARRLRKGQ